MSIEARGTTAPTPPSGTTLFWTVARVALPMRVRRMSRWPTTMSAAVTAMQKR